MTVRIVVLLMLLAVSCGASAEYGFELRQSFSVGSDPLATAIGDVSGDQRDDLLVATGCCGVDPGNDYKLLVFVQSPDGTLQPPVIHAYGATVGLSSVVKLADMDDDGDNDIIVSHSGGLSILRNDSDMAFSLRTFGRPSGPLTLDFMDVDTDGNLDIVGQLGYGAQEGGEIYFGDGEGWIRNQVLLNIQASNDMQVGDMNNDERPDLVVAGYGQILIYPHNGTSGFSTTPVVVPADFGWGIGRLAIGDFNDDGRNDIAAGRSSNSPTFVAVFYQRPGGSFRSHVTMASYDIPDVMIAEDMDGDGRQDLLVTHAGWFATGLYLGRPGGFAQEALFQVIAPDYASQLATGDINGDGQKDIVIVARQDTAVQTLLGRGSPLAVDLGVSLGMTDTVIAVRLDNYSHAAATGPIQLLVDVSLRSGTFAMGPVFGCTRQPLETGGFRVICQLAELMADTSRTLLLPLSIPPRAGRQLVTVEAFAAAPAGDLVQGNNRAWKQLAIPPASTKRFGKLRTQEKLSVEERPLRLQPVD